MNIHEYQAKNLLRHAGVEVPDFAAVATADGAASAYDRLGGGTMVVKAQVHAGGRGKGVVIGVRQDPKDAYEVACGRKPAPENVVRGVKLVHSREETRAVADAMLGRKLVTYQTGPVGHAIGHVLVSVAFDIDRELYLGITVDRNLKCPVLIASPEGGVEIERLAVESPEKILRIPIDVGLGLQDFQARKICAFLGLKGDTAKSGVQQFKALARFFIDKDVALAEINPLIVSKDGDLLALDAKIGFDDNAVARHNDVAAMRDIDEEDPAEHRAAQHGLSYVSLNGNIACLVNGAGLAMSTMDIIKHHGGEPANFLDVGGGAEEKQVEEAFHILFGTKGEKAVLVNIFGGIMKCDTIAGALLKALEKFPNHPPLVIRLEGTNVNAGRALLQNSGRQLLIATDLTDAARKAVAAATGAV